MPIRITHLTSVHKRYDTRIFFKMCTSLANYERFDVSLIVADSKGNEVKNDVSIIDVGARTCGHLSRMINTTNKVYEKALELDSDVYHLHDPELMPIGLKLKRKGKVVIFDAHEDFPKQLLSKPYLNKFARYVLSFIAKKYENYACRRFDAIVSATPYIAEKFKKVNPKGCDVNNYPILGELENEVAWSEKEDAVCYVGGISEVRGIREIVKSMEHTKSVTLLLAGTFSEKSVEAEVQTYEGWKHVRQLGFLDRNGVSDVMTRSKAGLVTLHPIINYQEALPVKMFEYMMAGLPVIASDITLWKQIIYGNKCGICVDPFDCIAIAEAIDYLNSNPEAAEEMGENGKRAIQKTYNWSIEEKKLFKLYEELLA